MCTINISVIVVHCFFSFSRADIKMIANKNALCEIGVDD